MNPLFKQLKEDHKEVKDILSRIDASGPEATEKRKELVLELKQKLVPHARAEEKVLYSHMLNENRDLEVAGLEGFIEHEAVDVLLPELLEMDASTPLWQAKFIVLKEALEHHIREEENEFFKKCEKNMDADYDELLEEFCALKGELGRSLPSQKEFGMLPEEAAASHGLM
jgi:hypothetical protein